MQSDISEASQSLFRLATWYSGSMHSSFRRFVSVIASSALAFAPSAFALQYNPTYDVFFMNIDDPEDVSDNDGLRFGGLLNEFLFFDKTASRFVLTDDLYVEGNLTVTGLVNGVDVSSLGGGDVTVVYKSENETVSNSIALQDDDHLTFTAEPDTSYEIGLYLFGRGNTAADFRFALNGQTGATCTWGIVEMESATSAVGTDCDGTPTALTAIPANSATIYEPYIGWGIYHNGSTQGPVTLQWAQNAVNANNVELLQNSYMKIRRLP